MEFKHIEYNLEVEPPKSHCKHIVSYWSSGFRWEYESLVN